MQFDVCSIHFVLRHNRVGEDVVLYKDAERTEKAAAFCMLRQQVRLHQYIYNNMTSCAIAVTGVCSLVHWSSER
jgi:cobalamin-dependent methionine synthase I